MAEERYGWGSKDKETKVYLHVEVENWVREKLKDAAKRAGKSLPLFLRDLASQADQGKSI
jgi:hypothetical protein